LGRGNYCGGAAKEGVAAAVVDVIVIALEKSA
jgi:hypothetical protein